MMGLEEHLIGMFRGDSEFHEDAAPSHLGGAARRREEPVVADATPAASEPGAAATDWVATWVADAERELKKIPFFVRGKARRNTEQYAREHGLDVITLDTLYDAKAHFSR
jgi:light-independent protochlorophyllide reductase subunit B